MFAAVEKLYQNGIQIVPQWPPLVGQLGTYMDSRDTRKQCLKLWPLDFYANVPDRYNPQAVLWLPELVGIEGNYLLLRGLEEVGHRPKLPKGCDADYRRLQGDGNDADWAAARCAGVASNKNKLLVVRLITASIDTERDG